MIELSKMTDLFMSIFNNLKHLEQPHSNDSTHTTIMESIFWDVLLSADAAEKIKTYRSADPMEGWIEFKQKQGYLKSVHLRNKWRILTKKSHRYGRRRIKHKFRLLMVQRDSMRPSADTVSLRRGPICKLLMQKKALQRRSFRKRHVLNDNVF